MSGWDIFKDSDGKYSATRALAIFVIINVVVMLWVWMTCFNGEVVLENSRTVIMMEESGGWLSVIMSLIAFSMSALGLSSVGGRLIQLKYNNGTTISTTKVEEK